ncbi:MAG: HutD family protein [Enterobacteriaceae bacterium]
MPWKNGQGVTREVARYPEAGEYDWRISLATIRQPGPFSAFPVPAQYQRAGRRRDVPDNRWAAQLPVRLSRRWGLTARAASCEIVGGPLLDLM